MIVNYRIKVIKLTNIVVRINVTIYYLVLKLFLNKKKKKHKIINNK